MKLIYWPNVHIELNQYLTNFTIYNTSFKIFTANDSFPLKYFEVSFQIFLESFLFQNFKIFSFILVAPLSNDAQIDFGCKDMEFNCRSFFDVKPQPLLYLWGEVAIVTSSQKHSTFNVTPHTTR